MDRIDKRSATDDRDLVPRNPAHNNFLVYCDESGIDGKQKFVGFGSLWLPHERRGDFTALVESSRRAHRHGDEIKWKNVKASNLRFYQDLVDAFFRTPWLAFHSIVIRKQVIDRTLHKSNTEALLKFFAHFVSNKIKRSAVLSKDRRYYVRVDPLPSPYPKAHEAEQNIIGSMIRQKLGATFLEALDVRDSKGTPGIQVADLLLGATMGNFQDLAKADHKRELMKYIASYLGWPDLRADTFPGERKFNIWYFHDPRSGERELHSRRVALRYPLNEKSFAAKIPTKRR